MSYCDKIECKCQSKDERDCILSGRPTFSIQDCKLTKDLEREIINSQVSIYKSISEPIYKEVEYINDPNEPYQVEREGYYKLDNYDEIRDQLFDYLNKRTDVEYDRLINNDVISVNDFMKFYELLEIVKFGKNNKIVSVDRDNLQNIIVKNNAFKWNWGDEFFDNTHHSILLRAVYVNELLSKKFKNNKFRLVKNQEYDYDLGEYMDCYHSEIDGDDVDKALETHRHDLYSICENIIDFMDGVRGLHHYKFKFD